MSVGVTPGDTLCVCGHTIGWHVFCYEMEEFNGCQICTGCPSVDHFATVETFTAYDWQGKAIFCATSVERVQQHVNENVPEGYLVTIRLNKTSDGTSWTRPARGREVAIREVKAWARY